MRESYFCAPVPLRQQYVRHQGLRDSIYDTTLCIVCDLVLTNQHAGGREAYALRRPFIKEKGDFDVVARIII